MISFGQALRNYRSKLNKQKSAFLYRVAFKYFYDLQETNPSKGVQFFEFICEKIKRNNAKANAKREVNRIRKNEEHLNYCFSLAKKQYPNMV